MTVLAGGPVEVCAEEVVHEIPAGRFHARRFSVDVIAFAIEVVGISAGDYELSFGEVVLFKERSDIFASDNAGTLILQKGRRVPFEDLNCMAETLESDACEETTEGAADLWESG